MFDPASSGCYYFHNSPRRPLFEPEPSYPRSYTVSAGDTRQHEDFSSPISAVLAATMMPAIAASACASGSTISILVFGKNPRIPRGWLRPNSPRHWTSRSPSSSATGSGATASGQAACRPKRSCAARKPSGGFPGFRSFKRTSSFPPAGHARPRLDWRSSSAGNGPPDSSSVSHAGTE